MTLSPCLQKPGAIYLLTLLIRTHPSFQALELHREIVPQYRPSDHQLVNNSQLYLSSIEVLHYSHPYPFTNPQLNPFLYEVPGSGIERASGVTHNQRDNNSSNDSLHASVHRVQRQ